MTNRQNRKLSAERAYELLVAEEELILDAQVAIQRALDERGISQKRLAEELGVGESYVSQMLGASARNLTLRTIARVMKALDAKATVVLDEHADHSAGAAPTDPSSEMKEAAAMASRVASSRLTDVWGTLVAIPDRDRSGRRRGGDAEAYASYDPPVQEMALAA